MGGDKEILQNIMQLERIWIPIPVLGELIYGALNSSQRQLNLEKIKKLKMLVEIIHCDEKAAERYAEIRLELKRKGKPIPENDIWAAACAEVKGVPLVTRDDHFDAIESLKRVRW